MNEIVGPIYYVMASDPDLSYRAHAEVDCFFCFTALMSEIRDFFIKTLDDAEGGIKFMMGLLSNMLKTKDIASEEPRAATAVLQLQVAHPPALAGVSTARCAANLGFGILGRAAL
ncbi:GL18130 [Drosophila persimilis]|uniref:GL18130 n=1 Tax=Drosophila persimilis TaxID=7234 RepID=B4IRA4_DROPE|nr:GL18130 [Drosophila persimilis]